jgi:hypothetical protein
VPVKGQVVWVEREPLASAERSLLTEHSELGGLAMPDCFISYSTKDDAFARSVHTNLTAHGLDTFMAGISLQPGDPWSETIRTALRASGWIIFLASRAACKSPHVQQELGSALDGSKRLIPVVWDMEPTELPGWVNQHQALDLRSSTPLQIHERITAIAARIKQDKNRGLLIGGSLVAGLIYLIARSE